MSIPTATWHDYPPTIEFESTDLPQKIVREFAVIALKLINARMEHDEVMRIGQGHLSERDTYIFPVTSKRKPEIRVFGPEIVMLHNADANNPDRHQGLLDLAMRRLKIADLDSSNEIL